MNSATPLHLAVAGGHVEVVKFLLQLGASPLEENNVRVLYTDLFTQILFLIFFLVHMSANFQLISFSNWKVHVHLQEGMNALHLAAKFGHVELLDVFKKHRVSWKTASRRTGYAPLHIGALFGQHEVVRELLTEVPAGMRTAAAHPSLLAAASAPSDAHNVGVGGGVGVGAHAKAAAGNKRGVGAAQSATGSSIGIGIGGIGGGGGAGGSRVALEVDLRQLPIADHGLCALHMASYAGQESVVRLLLNCEGLQVDAASTLNVRVGENFE